MALRNSLHKSGRCLAVHRAHGKVVEAKSDCAAIAVQVVQQ
jgi:hypothetical protein